MSDLIPPIFGADDHDRNAALARASREGLAIWYFAAPAIGLLLSFGLAVGFRLSGAGESTRILTICSYSLLMIGVMATFHAHRAARVLHSTVRLVWYGYAIVFWIFGCALVIALDTSLSLYKFHI